MATVFERVRKIIAEQLGVDEANIAPKTSFVEDLNADSLDLVELIMSLEEEADEIAREENRDHPRASGAPRSRTEL